MLPLWMQLWIQHTLKKCLYSLFHYFCANNAYLTQDKVLLWNAIFWKKKIKLDILWRNTYLNYFCSFSWTIITKGLPWKELKAIINIVLFFLDKTFKYSALFHWSPCRQSHANHFFRNEFPTQFSVLITLKNMFFCSSQLFRNTSRITMKWKTWRLQPC